MMRNRSNASNKKETSENYWKRRPSEIRGYNRTLYTTTEDNEYVRVDYNIKEKKIRLYIEDNEEGGNPYYSVISNGKITVERNATTGRISNLSDKFTKRADVFSSIPNKDIVRLINKNYGIGVKGDRIVSKEEGKKRNEQKKVELEQIRKKYFGIEPDIPISFVETERDKKARVKQRKIHLIDFLDLAVGITLCIILYTINHNFVTLGVLSGFLGIFIGLLDVYYRERELKLIKMLLFLVAGIIFYIYGYYIL